MTNNKLITWLAVMFFVASPAIAWSLHHVHDHKYKDTLHASYLYSAIAVFNQNSGGDPIQNITIDSFSCTDTIWCVAKVHNNNGVDGSMLFGSFFGDYSKIRMLSFPFTPAFEKNISGGIGVPYAVLNELNSRYGIKQ